MEAPRTTQFTHQQSTAIKTRDVSVVLASGAGCGKTHVLTHRYLSHLTTDNAEIAQIVAITFTDRAAREMRDRIRRALTAEWQRDPSPRWEKHLGNLETATIATIHSFCGNLLRQYAVPAGLDPQFDVLNPVLAEQLQQESLRSTFERLLASDQPEPAGHDLRELIVLYGWGSTMQTVGTMLAERDPAGWKQWLNRSAADIANDWQTTRYEELWPRWVNHLRTADPAIVQLIRLFETIPCTGPSMKLNVQKVLAGLETLTSVVDLPATVHELCESAKVGKDRAKAWPDEDSYERVKAAMEAFRKRLPDALALFLDDPGDVQQAAEVSQRFTRVAYAVAEDFTKRKAALGVLDFQDLLLRARDFLRDHEKVRTELQQRFRFLLLDEMQDTDPVQMDFIRLLAGAELTQGKLFAVGDQKQSIYRFRGADVTQFESLQRDVPPEGRLHLTLNFRSQPGLLHFVNALCSLRMPDYEPLQASRVAAHTDACAEFLWSVPESDADVETASAVREREATMLARRIRKLLADPTQRVCDRETNARRCVQPGDVVLLFRSMSNVAIYETALRQHELNYYLVGGRAFFAQQEIYDLCNLLRTLENPADSISVAGLLRSPFGCLSDETLLILGTHRDGLWAGLYDGSCLAKLPTVQRTQAERIGRLLCTWRAHKDRCTIAQLLTMAINDTGYDAAVQFEFLGDRKLANLWKMVELARSYDRSGLFGLPEFIARLDELIKAQPREEQAATQPENADVIKIMSIHQAKGLEFPVVVLPDFAAETRRGTTAAARWDRVLGCLPKPPREDRLVTVDGQPMWKRDQPLFTDFPYLLGEAYETLADWQEDLRILYVACTRPRDLLILSAGFKDDFARDDSDQPIPQKVTNAWLGVLQERFHLRTGRCLASDIPANECPKVRVRLETPVHDEEPTLRRVSAHVMPTLQPAQFRPVDADRSLTIIPAEVYFGYPHNPLRDALHDFDPDGPLFDDDVLTRLRDSPWPARWVKANVKYQQLEYLVPVGPGLPLVRGRLDWLWQDEAGWHLLFLATAERDEAEFRLQVRAVSEHFAQPLHEAVWFVLATGEARLYEGKALVDVANAVWPSSQQLGRPNDSPLTSES